MTSSPKAKAKPGAFSLTFDKDQVFRPGYVVISTSTARGGVRYERRDLDHQAHNDGSEDRRHVTAKHTDNVQIVKNTLALVKLSDYALKKHCSHTAFGWFADQANLSGLEEAFIPLRAKADVFNNQARNIGSARRVHVGYVAAKLTLDEFASREIAATIVDALKAFQEALRNGEVRDVKDPVSKKVIKRDQVRAVEVSRSNLGELAIGMAKDILKLAMESIRPAKKRILAAIEAGTSPADAGSSEDLTAIDNAIFFFSQGLLL